MSFKHFRADSQTGGGNDKPVISDNTPEIEDSTESTQTDSAKKPTRLRDPKTGQFVKSLLGVFDETDILKGDVLYESLVIDGLPITFPYMPKAHTSSIVDGEIVTKPVEPAHLTQAKLLSEGRGNPVSCFNAFIKEALIHAMPGVAAHVSMGRIQMHSGIKRGFLHTNNHGIYVNPADAQSAVHEGLAYLRSIDSDGDWGFQAKISPTYAVLLKNPNAGRLRVWGVQRDLPNPIFFDMDGKKFKEAWALSEKNLISDWLGDDGKIMQNDEMRMKVFAKLHTPLPVGVIDAGLKAETFEFMAQTEKDEGAKSLSYKQALLPHPMLFQALERGALKLSRSDESKKSAGTSVLSMLEIFDTRLEPKLSWCLTNTGRVGSRNIDQLDFAIKESFEKLIDRAINLDFKESDFLSAKKRAEETALRREQRLAAMRANGQEPIDPKKITYTYDKPKDFDDFALVGRMMKHGFLKSMIVKSENCEVPSRLVWLEDGKGNPVALTDVKSEEWSPDMLTYCFVLPPVYSARHKRVVDPLWWLAYCLAPKYNALDELIEGTESHIVNPATNNVRLFLEPYSTPTGYYTVVDDKNSPIPVAGKELDMTNENYGLKVLRLLAFISDHVSKYGIPTPAIINEKGKPEPIRSHTTPEGKAYCMSTLIARSSVIVDFGKDCENWEQMWKIFTKITFKDKEGRSRILAPGSKSNNPRIRKYGIADIENTTLPVWADQRVYSTWSPETREWAIENGIELNGVALPLTNGRRSSQMFSQLSRSIKGQILRVAIPCATTDFGALMKELGALAEDTNPVTQYQSYQKYEELVNGLDGQGTPGQAFITPSGTAKLNVETTHFTDYVNTPTEGYTKEAKWHDMKGMERVAWRRDRNKLTSKVGKIVDTYGNKMVPSPTKQAKLEDDSNIDLIFPAEELIDKGAFMALTMGGEIKPVLINGKTIKCRIINMEVSRTSGTTDNSPTMSRKKWFRHTDAHMFVAACEQGGFFDWEVTRHPMTDYSLALIKVAKKLAIYLQIVSI